MNEETPTTPPIESTASNPNLEEVTAMQNQASGLRQARNHMTGRDYFSVVSLGIAVLALAANVYNSSVFEVRLAEVKSDNAQKFALMMQKQRAQVAGAGILEVREKVDIKAPENAPRIGSKDAKVEIIEYSDFQCPYCHKFFEETLPQIKAEYIETGKASFIYQNFSFLGKESDLAAQASLCAHEQGKYWEYHDGLFKLIQGENEGSFTSSSLTKLATQVGAEKTTFATCLASEKYAAQVAAEQEEGRKYGVSGTPTIFVNGTRMVGALTFAQFQEQIEKALAE